MPQPTARVVFHTTCRPHSSVASWGLISNSDLERLRASSCSPACSGRRWRWAGTGWWCSCSPPPPPPRHARHQEPTGALNSPPRSRRISSTLLCGSVRWVVTRTVGAGGDVLPVEGVVGVVGIGAAVRVGLGKGCSFRAPVERAQVDSPLLQQSSHRHVSSSSKGISAEEWRAYAR